MERAERIIERIRALTPEEFERLAPYLEADLDTDADLTDLREEALRGMESARTQPKVPHSEALRRATTRLSRDK